VITLLFLDAAQHCLRNPAGLPCYICRAPRGHAGPHEYVPNDMVVIAEDAEPIRESLEQPVV
jgi:hypothetical protein